MNITRRVELPLLLKYLNLPLIVCEVGVAGASNSVDLLKAGIEYIYCVDNWEYIPDVTGDGNFPNDFHESNYNIALEILSPFKNKYKVLKGLSSEMHKFIEDNSLGLLYIDGWHTYEGTKQDLENYYPKVVKNGIISVHDYYNTGYGVKEAVDEFVNSKNLTIFTLDEDGVDNNKSVWFQIN